MEGFPLQVLVLTLPHLHPVLTNNNPVIAVNKKEPRVILCNSLISEFSKINKLRFTRVIIENHHQMSFSSIPSFRSGTASPSKTVVQSQLQNVLSPSSLSNRSSSPAPSTANANLTPSSNPATFIPWSTSQGKLYKSIGEEAWKKCEKTVATKNSEKSFYKYIRLFLEC